MKYALKNALDYGKANERAVIAKVMGEHPEWRKNAKEIVKRTKEIIEEIDAWDDDKKRKKLLELWPDVFEEKEKKEELPELPGAVKGNVVMMFPPEPSKYPHIGHAKAALLNYVYARKYNGTFILRFEDSNPAKVEEQYYKIQEEDYKWLGMEWDKVDYISDHMDTFYSIVERLLAEKKAYVCTCEKEKIRRDRTEKKACECRDGRNNRLWEEIKKGAGYVVRMKTDMTHKNAAMRDPTIMRVVDKEHPRTGNKYKAWPTYEFATSVMDGIEGITHRIRSKEFETKNEVQAFMRTACGFHNPVIISIGRLNLEGIEAAGRKNRELVESGKYMGWDDPRLPTLRSFKRRGFKPEAIKEFVLRSGISKADSTLPMSVLESINRKYIEPEANRLFFVPDPKKIVVEGIPKTVVRLKNHPSFPERGFREYVLEGTVTFYVPEVLNEFRLKDAFNVKDGQYNGEELMDIPKIQWVHEGNHVECSVVMPDASIVSGVIEKAILDAKVGQRFQLERFGYVILDSLKDGISFWYTHK